MAVSPYAVRLPKLFWDFYILSILLTLLTLAQEIAVLETIKQLAEENSFSENRQFVEFLQEKDISGKRLNFKELLLDS